MLKSWVPGLRGLNHFGQVSRSLKSLRSDWKAGNPSAQWTKYLDSHFKSKEGASQLSILGPGWRFSRALSILSVKQSLYGMNFMLPLLKNINWRTQEADTSQIGSRVIGVMFDNPETNQTFIFYRGTETLAEFIASIGAESGFFHLNNDVTVPLEEVLKPPPGVEKPSGNAKASVWLSTMSSSISCTDAAGNTKVICPTMIQEITDFVSSIKPGREIRIVAHSLSASLAYATNLAIAWNSEIKPKSVETLICGGFNTLDAKAVAYFERVCKFPITNLNCTNDPVAKLYNAETAMNVAILSPEVYPNQVKVNLDNLPFKPVGQSVWFHMKFGASWCSFWIQHCLRTYLRALDPDNIEYLFKDGDKEVRACSALTLDEQKQIIADDVLKYLRPDQE